MADDVLANASDERPGAEQQIECQEARSLVLELLGEIDPAAAAVVIAHGIDGIPMAEIAEQLGLPLSTMYKRRARAMAALMRHCKSWRGGHALEGALLVELLAKGDGRARHALAEVAAGRWAAAVELLERLIGGGGEEGRPLVLRRLGRLGGARGWAVRNLHSAPRPACDAGISSTASPARDPGRSPRGRRSRAGRTSPPRPSPRSVAQRGRLGFALHRHAVAGRHRTAIRGSRRVIRG